MSAVIYQVSPGVDKALILDTRQQFIYPFDSPNWLDLRVGFYLSICQAGDNAAVGPPMIETLVTTGIPADRFWIGLKTNNTILPHTVGATFLGYSNSQNAGTLSGSSSTVVSSDLAVGTTNTNYWRVTGPGGGRFELSKENIQTSGIVITSYIHFPQNPVGAGGNATMVLFRVIRSASVNPFSYTISAYFNAATVDYAFDSTCLISTIRNGFRNAAWSGTFTTGVPYSSFLLDALYAYWPFNNSKLRIHALCIEKFA
jgi:hypothetical protein